MPSHDNASRCFRNLAHLRSRHANTIKKKLTMQAFFLFLSININADFYLKKLDKNIAIHVYLHFILILNNPIYIITTELIKSTYDFTMNGRHSKIFFQATCNC